MKRMLVFSLLLLVKSFTLYAQDETDPTVIITKINKEFKEKMMGVENDQLEATLTNQKP